jgi:hypothetical protein
VSTKNKKRGAFPDSWRLSWRAGAPGRARLSHVWCPTRLGFGNAHASPRLWPSNLLCIRNLKEGVTEELRVVWQSCPQVQLATHEDAPIDDFREADRA